MLIYIESKVFPQKTFVLLVNQLDAIARARAQMLHILYELGKSDHQFRFRYKGIFLRDAYTFEDYKILDSSVLKMVPMAKQRIEIFTDANTPLDEKKRQVTDEVQQALLREVAVFNRRESILQALKVFLWLHLLSSLVSLSTVYFYSCVWTGIIVVYGFNYCPTYTRLGGFVATSNVSNEYFFVTFGLGMLLNLAASLTMSSFLLLDAIKHGCGELKGDCSDHNIWSILFFFVHSLCLLATLILLLICFFNCRIQVGDIIEYYLVQNKDITKVLKVAGSGSLKDRRNAAFELASLAATGDEAKHKIVHKQGLEVLMNLALCQDEATQEYATEALAELLTVSQIQDRFIELGGARTLCALLHSSSQQLMGESVMAISYIVADSDANKHAIVGDEGLYDLSSAAQRASAETARIISGIYLELSFTPEIRKMLVQDSSSGEALEVLCKASDEETQRLALQTLELLAIETPEFIVNRSELLDYVIGLPSTSSDDQLKILASKIILYYAEIPSTCEQLVESSCIKNCLLQLSHHPDAVFQNVVVKIILAILYNAEHRREVLQIGIIEALTYLHENSVNRDTWDMAERAIDLLHHITVMKREDPETASNSTATTGLVKRNASRNTSTPTTTL